APRRRFPREPAQDAGQHCRNERCDCGPQPRERRLAGRVCFMYVAVPRITPARVSAGLVSVGELVMSTPPGPPRPPDPPGLPDPATSIVSRCCFGVHRSVYCERLSTC